MASGVLAEKVTGLDVQWNNYLIVDRQLIGMVVERSDETTYTRYFHKDHLGSIAVITDEAGAVVERLSYDAWGRRRFPDGTDDPSGSITSQTTRGFTGHEELGDVSLVHMNGRVYDPLLGRFGSPDPTTENPFSTQGWNRYSYVGNAEFHRSIGLLLPRLFLALDVPLVCQSAAEYADPRRLTKDRGTIFLRTFCASLRSACIILRGWRDQRQAWRGAQSGPDHSADDRGFPYCRRPHGPRRLSGGV
jgi:RHS repeat-associated protein